MHTYAHPVWLGIDPAAPASDMTMVSITGTLARDAEARVRPDGPQGDALHVVCMDLQDLVPNARTVHVEYPHTDRAKAEAFAARYRKGMRITAHCPLQDARLSLLNTLQIDHQPHIVTRPQ